MGRKKRVVGKIIWGPRKGHTKDNGVVRTGDWNGKIILLF
jgi:hypothetical protein